MEQLTWKASPAKQFPLDLNKLTSNPFEKMSVEPKAIQAKAVYDEIITRMSFVDSMRQDNQEPIRVGGETYKSCLKAFRVMLTTYRRPAPATGKHAIFKEDIAQIQKTSPEKKLLNENLDEMLAVLRNEAGLPVDNFAQFKEKLFHVPFHGLLADSLDYNPELNGDAALVQRVYKKNFRDIWSFAYDAFYFIQHRTPFIEDGEEEDLSEPEDLFFNIHALLLLVELRLNTYVLVEKQRLMAKSETVQSRAEMRTEARKLKAEHEDEVHRLSKSLNSATAALNSAQSTIKSLQKSAKADAHRIAELERELAALKEQKRTEEAAIEVRSFEAEETLAEDVDEPKLVLPNSGRIWFVGGHQNMTNKVKALYPKWRYISTENAKAMESFTCNSARCDCIILYTAHVSHTLNDAFVDNCPKNCCILRCSSSTNIERLLAEIEEDWKRQGCPPIGGM